MTDEPRKLDPFAMTESERESLFLEYRTARSVGRELNHKLVKRLGKDVLDEGGRKLGLLKRGTLVFESEDEMAVLMDYCIFNVYRNGRNAAEQYLLSHAERLLLRVPSGESPRRLGRARERYADGQVAVHHRSGV
jgi:hypothetical protein